MLTGSSSITNIKRSLDKYCYDNLVTTESITVDWEGLIFEDTLYEEWIRPRILSILPTHRRKGSATEYAEDANILFHINIFVKKSRGVVSDRVWRIRDRINKYFKLKTDIDLKDYIAAGAQIDTMRVRRLATDISLPETDTLFQYAIAWEIDFTRLTTKS